MKPLCHNSLSFAYGKTLIPEMSQPFYLDIKTWLFIVCVKYKMSDLFWVSVNLEIHVCQAKLYKF